MYKYDTRTLANGLNIISHHMPNMKSVALGVWIGTGGRYESAGNRGISHFVEHILFKGTQKRTAAQIKNTIEGIGGMLNGFTSEEATCYLVKVLGLHLGLGLDVLADMVLNGRFSPRDIEKERMVILEEIKMYKDHPDQYVQEALGELMWPNQALGLPLIGTHGIINSLSRNDLVGYRDATYKPSNATVVACGDVEWPRLAEECGRAFSVRGKAKPQRYVTMKVSQDKPRSHLIHKNTEQTHIAIGFHSIKRSDPARHAADLLNIILGGNMSSRLFHELREKRGLAYSIGSHVAYFADGGFAMIEAGVDNRKICEALRLIVNELSRIKRQDVTRKEFDRAKEFYHGHLLFTLEDTVEHMLWIGKKIVTDDPPCDAQEILRRLSKVSIGDIRRVCEEIFVRQNINIAAIGPISDADKKTIDRILCEL